MSAPESPADRFSRLMPSGDLTLIVLKGHLIIEEQLNLLVERAMKKPTKLQEARLRFPQLVHLACALDDREDFDQISRVLLALNALRNDLAHRLESSDLQAKVERLENTFEDSCGTPVAEGSTEERLIRVLGFLWLFVQMNLAGDNHPLRTTRVAYEISYGVEQNDDE